MTVSLRTLEVSWRGRISVPGMYFGWEPFDPGRFTELLCGCLPYVGNRTFLDVGCGIGTKCLLAAQEGLDAYGFDRVPEYLTEARRLGVHCELADAHDYQDYGRFGLIYVNHPMRSHEDETELECLIHDRMASGSVLMKVNYGFAPDWAEIARLGDWDAAWVKP